MPILFCRYLTEFTTVYNWYKYIQNHEIKTDRTWVNHVIHIMLFKNNFNVQFSERTSCLEFRILLGTGNFDIGFVRRNKKSWPYLTSYVFLCVKTCFRQYSESMGDKKGVVCGPDIVQFLMRWCTCDCVQLHFDDFLMLPYVHVGRKRKIAVWKKLILCH